MREVAGKFPARREVFNSWKAITQRHAVCVPLAGVERCKRGASAAIGATRYWWNIKLRNLHAAGLDVSEAKLGFMLRCPPAGERASKWSRPCRKYAICPFCYMREVAGRAYDGMSAALIREDSNWKFPGSTLLYIAHTDMVDRLDPLYAISRLRLLKASLSSAFGVGLPRVFAGTIEPHFDKGYKVTVRTLAKAPTGDISEIRFRLGDTAYTQYSLCADRCSTGDFSRMVARTTRYPRWLLMGNPSMSAELINMLASRRVRRFERYGVCRLKDST